MPGIGVVFPVHNGQDHIGEAIRSALSQRYRGPLEIVVPDDASANRSPDAALGFVETLPFSQATVLR